MPMPKRSVWAAFSGSVLLLLTPVSGLTQTIYRCVDTAGKSTFSDQPCATARETQSIPSPRSETTRASIQVGKAPQELVNAYNRCLRTLRQREHVAYANCLSRRRSDLVLQAKTAFEGLAVGILALIPTAPQIVDGSINSSDGKAQLRMIGDLNGKRRYGVMDFVLEQGAWKLDSQGWGNVPFDEMPKFAAELNAALQRQRDLACASARTESTSNKTELLELQTGEKLISRFIVAPGKSQRFEYASTTEQLVMLRVNATDRLRCKFGSDYPVSICYAGEPCLSTWYGGRIMQAVNGRISGAVKNMADEGIEVIVVVAPRQ